MKANRILPAVTTRYIGKMREIVGYDILNDRMIVRHDVVIGNGCCGRTVRVKQYTSEVAKTTRAYSRQLILRALKKDGLSWRDADRV